jgi:type I restriction enzyme S subunit
MKTLQERVHGTPLPATWALGKLHRVLRVRKNFKNVGMKENNLLSLSYGRIIRKDIDAAEGLLPESFETYQIVEPGNLVLRLTDLQNDKRSLRQGLVHERGIITSAYDALEVSDDQEPRFWAYALLALDLAKYYYSLGGGVRQSINFADFPNDWIGVPDKQQQKAIAKFLDREIAHIDQLVEKKNKLIEILNERMATHQTVAVLGGDSPLRPHATAPWLSFAPSTWAHKTLRELASFRGGATPSKDNPEFWDGDIPWVSPKDMKRSYVSDSEDHITPQALKGSVSFVPEGSVLIVTRGMILSRTVPVALTTAPVTINQDMKALVPRRDITGVYLLCLLQGVESVLLSLVEEAAHGTKKLRTDRLFKTRFPIPPLDQQSRIASGILNCRQATQNSIRAIEESLRRLHELRAALITETVTGKLDVTVWKKRGMTERRTDAIEAGMGIPV